MSAARKPKLRGGTLFTALLLLCVALYAGYQHYLSPNASPAVQTGVALRSFSDMPGLKVHFIDIGQGDAALLESDDGAFMLIDAGPRSGAQKLVDYCLLQGVETLDYVVFTHPHEDHIGGGKSVLENFEVRQVLLPDTVHTSTTFEHLLDTMEKVKKERHLRVLAPKQDETFLFGNAYFTVLSGAPPEGENLNNASIVLKVTYGDVSFLFTGDAEKAAERALLDAEEEVSAQILKAGHHGSRTSSSEEFLDEVSPTVAVISCAQDNDYGHPHKETLQRFRERGVTVCRTDRNGCVVVVTDGKDFEVFAEKDRTKAA